MATEYPLSGKISTRKCPTCGHHEIGYELDRYFNSPHLAAGTSKDIVDALFEELDEVREPVLRLQAWLDRKDDDSFS